MNKYLKSLDRGDLTNWVVHFTKSIYLGSKILEPIDVLKKMLMEGAINPSKRDEIIRYEPGGAACFYEVPPRYWEDLVRTNPNGRRGIGIIFSKEVFWARGGRPVIYTDQSASALWPETQRFRIVATNLNRKPDSLDWTHEREWRIKGSLRIDLPQPVEPYWWPSVETEDEANEIFKEFLGIHQISVLERRGLLKRGGMYA